MGTTTTTTALLRDGTTVTIRPMRDDDEDALVRFHATLSFDTIYLRFFSAHPRLSPDEVHRFTHVDHRGREALVAVCEGEIIGVARFDVLDDGSAEVAFVVSDPWQGRGLGRVLFVQLAERARALGIPRLVAQTLPRNHRMLAVFNHAGLDARSWFEDGVVKVAMDL